MDIEFVKYIYHPQLNALHLSTNHTIREYILSHLHMFPWISRDDFIQQTGFDWRFYSIHYQLNTTSEIQAIYHYVNFGRYAEYRTTSMTTSMMTSMTTLSTLPIQQQVVQKHHISVLIVTHELCLNGGSLCAKELYLYLKCHSLGTIHLWNLAPQWKQAYPEHNNESIYNLDDYDVIVINTISPLVIDWCHDHPTVLPKSVVWVHETEDKYYTTRMTCLQFPMIVCDSFFTRQVLLQHYTRPNSFIKVMYLPRPVAIDNDMITTRQLMRRQYRLSDTTLVLMNLGSLCPYKNQILLLNTLVKYLLMMSDPYDIKLLLVTSRPLPQYFRDFLNNCECRKQLEKYLILVPPLEHESCTKYYAMGDVYVNCSPQEAFGKVLIESMQLKRPILAYKGGSHVELIHDGFNGKLFQTEEELWDAICFFYHDRSALQSFGEYGYQWSSKHSPLSHTFYNDMTSLLCIQRDRVQGRISLPCIDYSNICQHTCEELNILEARYWQDEDDENIVYIYGGYMKNSTQCNTRIWKLDVNDMTTVECVNDIPSDCATTHTFLQKYHHTILIVSGQVGDTFGCATSAFYQYNPQSNTFFKIQDLPFALYDPRCILDGDQLRVFSGTLADRTTPNMTMWSCHLTTTSDGWIVKDVVWTSTPSCCVGTCHSTLIEKTNSSPHNHTMYYYFHGCSCHVCSFFKHDELAMYTIPMDPPFSFSSSSFEKQIPLAHPIICTSHCESSCVWYTTQCLLMIGGQRPYDYIYHGLQVYLTEWNVWFEMSIDPSYLQYLTKGSIAFLNQNTLCILGGQMSHPETQRCISQFHQHVIRFPLL